MRHSSPLTALRFLHFKQEELTEQLHRYNWKQLDRRMNSQSKAFLLGKAALIIPKKSNDVVFLSLGETEVHTVRNRR